MLDAVLEVCAARSSNGMRDKNNNMIEKTDSKGCHLSKVRVEITQLPLL